MTGNTRRPLTLAFAALAAISAATLASPGHAAPPDNSYNPALPQFNIIGTDIMLHNSVYAEEAGNAVSKMETALRKCDQTAFENALRSARAVYYEADSRREGAVPYISVDTFGQDTSVLYQITEEYRKKWQLQCGDTKAQNSTKSTFSAGAGIHAGRINVPGLLYLGLEQAFTLIQTIGIVKGEQSASVAGGTLNGAYYLPNSNLWFGLGVSRSSADMTSEYSNIDPGGDGLLIPGPLGGASGFALPSAGGLNVVSTADFSSNYDWLSFYGKMGMPIDCGLNVFLPFFGIGYTRSDFDARFEGSIPGYGRDFAYNTNINTDTVSPMVGLYVKRKYDHFNLHAGGLVSVDFNDAKGTDRLSFTAFPDSQVSLKNDDTTVSGRVWAGISFGTDKSPFELSLDAAWIYAGNVPQISRDGINPTMLELKSAEAVTGTLRATFRF